MTFIQFLQAHYTSISLVGLLLFKTAVNAFPSEGQPFVFSQWFMEWLREIAQQTPNKFPPLPAAQAKVLGDAGVPLAIATTTTTGPLSTHINV